MNVLLTVAYDGTNYYGWQRQNGQVTIQEVLEKAISELLKKDVTVRGSSRTDSGVHALGQRVLLKEDISIPLSNLPYAINSFLPKDIRVVDAKEVKNDFHPQYSVIDKTYIYRIQNAKFPNPMLYNYTEFERRELNVENMQLSCKEFLGTYDFSAFCATGGNSKTKVRTIYDLTVSKNEEIVTIEIRGNGFLYNMVRIIAGTLIEVGLNKIEVNDIKNIILSKDRSKAGKTLCPNGLVLKEINIGDK